MFTTVKHDSAWQIKRFKRGLGFWHYIMNVFMCIYLSSSYSSVSNQQLFEHEYRCVNIC